MKLLKENVQEWLFKSEKDYSIRNVVATTFTLNPVMIIDLLARSVSAEENIEYKSMNAQQLTILLAKDFVSDSPMFKRITVFSDDYIIPPDGKIPNKYARLLNELFIPNCVCRISLKKQGSFFHPKILLVHYEKKENDNVKDYLKFAILSKNLTYSNMQEICVMFESVDDEQIDDKTVVDGKELKDFFDTFLSSNFLKDSGSLTGISLSVEDAKEKIQDTLRVVKNKKFKIILPDNEGICSASLQFVTPNSNSVKGILKMDSEKADSYYCCSDSISKSFWDKELAQCKDRILVSNIRSWAKYGGENASFPGGPSSDSIIDYAYFFANITKYMVSESKVHAKMAEFHNESKSILWAGSSNYTENGFGSNFEANVRIEYMNSENKRYTKKIENSICENSICGKKVFLLSNNPFYKDDSDGFAQVKNELILDERKKDKLKELIQNAAWTCDIVDNNQIQFKGQFRANEDTSILNGVKQFHLVTYDDIILYYYSNSNGTSPFLYSDKLPANKRSIPWYGSASIIAFMTTNDKMVIPIKVKVDKKLLDKQQIVEADDVDKLKKAAADVLRSKFDFISIIPPEPNGNINIYDENDTFDIRLGKYLAKGGDYENVNKVIDGLKRALSEDTDQSSDMVDGFSETDSDGDEEVDELIMTGEEIELLKKRLEKLESYIKLLEDINGQK